MSENYKGKVLIATPLMNDEYFQKVVIFLCSSDPTHSFGVILNKPSGFVNVGKGVKKKKMRLFNGGPVDNDTTFVLTASDEQEGKFLTDKELTLYVNAEEYLQDVLAKTRCSPFLICKGFTAWDAGQLESEIAEGSWLLADIEFEEIFSVRKEKLWEKLIKRCGIKNPKMVVPYSGRA